MTDEVDYKTLDLGAVLAGINYPKTVVSVYLDESVGYLITETNLELQKLSDAGDTEKYDELEKAFHDMLKSAEATRYEVHLTGVSRKIRNDIMTSIQAEFPLDTDIFGRVKPNIEANEAYVNKKWAVHIEKIVGPDGAVLAPVLPEDVQLFRDHAPDPAQDAIEAAIQELSDGAKAGFELAAQERVFLSTP